MDGHYQEDREQQLTRGDCIYIEAAYADKHNNFVRNIYIKKTEFYGFKKRHGNVGLFTSAYAYNVRNPAKAYLIGSLYLDLDDENNFGHIREDALLAIAFFENICGIYREDINIYFSGKKGIHITVPDTVFGFKPDKGLNKIFKSIASDISLMTNHGTVDTRIYDNRRLFRVPGSIHQETGLYKTPIMFDELNSLSRGEILRLAERPRLLKSKQPGQSPEYSKQANGIYLRYADKINQKENTDTLRQKHYISWSPPCVKMLYKRHTGRGERNNTVAMLAGHFRARGFHLTRTIEILAEWNSKYCAPPLTGKEIEKTVRSLYHSHKNYGCSTFQALELCDPACKYKK